MNEQSADQRSLVSYIELRYLGSYGCSLFDLGSYDCSLSDLIESEKLFESEFYTFAIPQTVCVGDRNSYREFKFFL